MPPGASTSPARPVKTTSDITRGLRRAMKSSTTGGVSAAAAGSVDAFRAMVAFDTFDPFPPLYDLGGVSWVWKGAGDGTVHSKVVAPSPQGLAPTCSLDLKIL